MKFSPFTGSIHCYFLILSRKTMGQGMAADKTVLNLFSYTCGIGMAACSGRAKQV